MAWIYFILGDLVYFNPQVSIDVCTFKLYRFNRNSPRKVETI